MVSNYLLNWIYLLALARKALLSLAPTYLSRPIFHYFALFFTPLSPFALQRVGSSAFLSFSVLFSKLALPFFLLYLSRPMNCKGTLLPLLCWPYHYTVLCNLSQTLSQALRGPPWTGQQIQDWASIQLGNGSPLLIEIKNFPSNSIKNPYLGEGRETKIGG